MERRPLRPSPGGLTAFLLACLVALVAAACGDDGGSAEPGDDGGSVDEEAFAGYSRDPAPSVASVTLPLADGSGEASLVADPGGLRVVYFGYTSCPDVCPTTMSDLRQALNGLTEEERSRVAVDMVTIDPARDVPEKLTDYVTTFVPTGRGLRTEDDAVLRAAAEAFGADYEVRPAADGGEPEVSHTAELYVVDDTGRILLAWPFGTTKEDIGSDLRRLLAGDRPEPAT